VKRVIAASSASVYGMAEKFPTMETHHPYHNRALYGAAKTFNEGLLRSFRDMYGLDYVALRYFNVYGPRMDIHGAYTEVLVRWMEQIASGRPPVIFGDGRQTMDLVYVDDVARANLLAAKSNVSDEVFNVGTGVETSLADLATKLRDVMGSDIGVEYCPERKTASIRKRQADVSSARDRLGFEPLVSLEEGLRRLVEWWRKEREGHEKPPV
jgi:UDP-glucose 4-epimerase